MRDRDCSLFSAFASFVVIAAVLTISGVLVNTYNICVAYNTADELHCRDIDITFEPCVLVFEESIDVVYKEMPVIKRELSDETSSVIFKPVSLTQDERELLARIVWCEAGTEGPYGMALVTDVILNRVRIGNSFPNSIAEVIFASGQFDAVNRADFNSVHVPDRVYNVIDGELISQADYESLYFARSPLTQKGLYRYGRHYFSY